MNRRSRVLRLAGSWLGYAAVVAVVVAPLTVERAIENAVFADRLGAFPVEISLSHNGVSTLDTGVAGKLYWDRTGVAGFGANVRSTGPPVAGGTLGSYVSQDFVQANAAFVDDPAEIARVYGAELRNRVLRSFLLYELVSALLGGSLMWALFRGALPLVPGRLGSRATRAALRSAYVLTATAASVAVASAMFGRWDGSREVGDSYSLAEVPGLSFSSPQTLEVARQVRPFLEKNAARIEERSGRYRQAAEENLSEQLAMYGEGLQPREGEVVVLAEADPQGSRVATRVRTDLYAQLSDALGDDAIASRTIAGDVTSNGAVAEKGFVQDEAGASPGIPVVAVKGDHDSGITVEQLRDADVEVPDLEVVESGELLIAGAGDPESKALFGGLVTNESGTGQAELGGDLRRVVDEEVEDGRAVQVVLHQPAAAAAYLGIDSIDSLRYSTLGSTVPHDDGIPDVPPGSVSVGHLHDADGPWVIWNTDGDDITWTVVSQLGTSGGTEESPTFNRFSTPFSVPLKEVSVRLNYVDRDSGLQTGYASIVIGTDGSVDVEARVDVGLSPTP